MAMWAGAMCNVQCAMCCACACTCARTVEYRQWREDVPFAPIRPAVTRTANSFRGEGRGERGEGDIGWVRRVSAWVELEYSTYEVELATGKHTFTFTFTFTFTHQQHHMLHRILFTDNTTYYDVLCTYYIEYYSPREPDGYL